MNYKIVEVKPNTVKFNHMLNVIRKVQRRGAVSLIGAYKNPSQAKVDAYNDIAKFALENDGTLSIVHAGCQRFTALVETPDAYYYIARLCYKLRKEDIK